MKTGSPHPTSPRGGFRFLPLGGVGGGLLLLLFLLQACSPSLPSGILDEDEMTDVLVDLHLAQGMAEANPENGIDVTRYKYIQAVFRKHRITEAEFDSSMVYYSGRAEDFTQIYNNVVNRVRAQAERMGLEAAAQDKFASLTSEGDTANIWLGKDFACVLPTQAGCVYSFQMKADTTFRPGDSFIWRFGTQFVARSMNNEAIALLNFYYDTDTVATVNDLLRNSSKNELHHAPSHGLDTLNLRSITGFIYLPIVRSADQPKPLLISGIKLIRMHKYVEEQKSGEMNPANRASDTAADTLGIDTLSQQRNERLTPLQMRESQPRKRTIRVTKENPNPIHPQRGIPQRTNRRR